MLLAGTLRPRAGSRRCCHGTGLPSVLGDDGTLQWHLTILDSDIYPPEARKASLPYFAENWNGDCGHLASQRPLAMMAIDSGIHRGKINTARGGRVERAEEQG